MAPKPNHTHALPCRMLLYLFCHRCHYSASRGLCCSRWASHPTRAPALCYHHAILWLALPTLSIAALLRPAHLFAKRDTPNFKLRQLNETPWFHLCCRPGSRSAGALQVLKGYWNTSRKSIMYRRKASWPVGAGIRTPHAAPRSYHHHIRLAL